MTTEFNNSLIGFLAKKSLFNVSPSKNKSNRSLSKDFRKDILNISQLKIKKQNTTSQIFQIPLSKDLSSKQFPTSLLDQSQVQFEQKISRIKTPKNTRFNNTNKQGKTLRKTDSFLQSTTQQKKYFNSSTKNPQKSSIFNKAGLQNKSSLVKKASEREQNLWKGSLIQKSHISQHFQSARIQSFQCLQDLSIKLSNQLSNVNFKINQFNSKIFNVLNQELKYLKENVCRIVEQVFKQSENILSQYMQRQELIFAKDLLDVKQKLQNQYKKVQTMKVDISGFNWRQAAGELLSTELQHKVQTLLKQSNNSDIGKWHLKDFDKGKLQSLQNQLKILVSFDR